MCVVWSEAWEGVSGWDRTGSEGGGRTGVGMVWAWVELVAYLDVHLVVSGSVNGSIEPKAYHEDALVD
jgi:hypothetical protein